MDLIYMNSAKEDIGVLHDYTFDLAFGSNENDFECTIVRSNHCCKKDFFLYIEGTEYGGIIDDIESDSEKDEIKYHGRTWHGILNSKILEPNSGADYLILNGEANSILGLLIARMGLTSLFSVSTDASGITISNYKMNRYIAGYDGIMKMLKESGAKLNIIFKNGFVELSAKPIVDYSKDEQFDKDQIAFSVKQKGNKTNHVICLGKGDLSKREVIHVYADSKGNISEKQVFTGLDEVVAIYENTNAADSAELKQGGIDIIKEAWASDEVDATFNFIDECYDIGDIVGANDTEVGVNVRMEISKKIVSISNGEVAISYPSDSKNKTGTSLSGGGSSNENHGAKLLWTNSNTSAEFEAQSVEIDGSDYMIFFATFNSSATNTRKITAMLYKSWNTDVQHFSNYDNASSGLRFECRPTGISSDGKTVTFRDCVTRVGDAVTSPNNARLIPTSIWGIPSSM